jgi:hypothetical protein
MKSDAVLPQSIHHPGITTHAAVRMQQRGISPALVEAVLEYGRTVHARGLTFRVIGRKEVARYTDLGLDLSRAEGVHVLVESDSAVVTTYRNHDLRKIRPSKRKHAMHH